MQNGFWKDPENRVFFTSLLGSLIVHIILIGNIAFMELKRPKTRIVYRPAKAERQLPVPKYTSSAKAQTMPEADAEASQLPSAQPEPNSLLTSIMNSMKKNALAKGIKPDVRRFDEMPLKDRMMIDDETFKRLIRVDDMPEDKRIKRIYIEYYDEVREKIKTAAYAKYNNKMPQGQVYISFTLSRDGRIIAATVDRSKSEGTDALYRFVLGILEECDPFPIFPEQLVHNELTFNVIILFKRE